jgi:hypothetical protein
MDSFASFQKRACDPQANSSGSNEQWSHTYLLDLGNGARGEIPTRLAGLTFQFACVNSTVDLSGL